MTDKLDCEVGGCSAKLAAQELDDLLKTLPILRPKELLIGIENHDDAAIWKIDDNTAIIQTTDFFPPICEDPYDFGQIAATNALSDIYAMGGIPLLALNLVMFPSKKENMEQLKEILRGGADKLKEANTALAGGHTIDDINPKYGLSVMGKVHPDKITANKNLKINEVLILTKPLGNGIICAGKRLNLCNENNYLFAINQMKRLNLSASLIMQKYQVRAATDITGFGLLGHALKMAQASNIQIEIDTDHLPSLPFAYELIEMGCIPNAAFRNLKFVEDKVHFDKNIDYNLKMLAIDAQTSGGILMSVKSVNVDNIITDLHINGDNYARVIGRTKSLEENAPWIIMK